MTRVNSAVAPEKLIDQHLLAEYREILRVNSMAINGYKKQGKKYLEKCPQTFTLNTGHMKFFANKLLFIKKRFNELRKELISREYQVTMTYQEKDIPKELFKDYQPTDEEKNKLIERILLRFPKNPTYYRKPITIKQYIDIIT